VASFQDALTRQVSEAVRIDLRGSGVLNSRSEYSRCRLPRLMIDTEEWRVKKKEEKKALEPEKIVTEICTEEEGIDNELAVEEESARRMTSKRKEWKDEKLKPAKRMKLAPLTNWGGKVTEKRQGVLDWLTVPEETKVQDDDDDRNWLGTEVNIHKSKKLRQLELGCKGATFLNKVKDDISGIKNTSSLNISGNETGEKEVDNEKDNAEDISPGDKSSEKTAKPKVIPKKPRTGKMSKKESRLIAEKNYKVTSWI
jgi:hypothetical protein